MALTPARQALILKRASPSRASGEWKRTISTSWQMGPVVGPIFNANASPIGRWPSDIMGIAARRINQSRGAVTYDAKLDVSKIQAK
jgi:hypothetical protein